MTAFTWKGRHRPLQQNMQLWKWPMDNIHCTQHRLRPFLGNNDTLKSRDQIILQIPMRHPFITFSKDHFPPGIILLTKRTVVPATQQDTYQIQVLMHNGYNINISAYLPNVFTIAFDTIIPSPSLVIEALRKS